MLQSFETCSTAVIAGEETQCKEVIEERPDRMASLRFENDVAFGLGRACVCVCAGEELC